MMQDPIEHYCRVERYGPGTNITDENIKAVRDVLLSDSAIGIPNCEFGQTVRVKSTGEPSYVMIRLLNIGDEEVGGWAARNDWRAVLPVPRTMEEGSFGYVQLTIITFTQFPLAE